MTVDTFSPAWMAGYVLGRRPHGPSELPAARTRAAETGSAVSFDDGYDTGQASAARLPHRALINTPLPYLDLETRELELDSDRIDGADEVGLYTGDPVFIESVDEDRQLSWTARGRVVSSDLSSGRVTVYIEEQFE